MSTRAIAAYLTLFLASLLSLQGCLKPENIRPTANVVLLQYEYETVRDQFRDADLTVEERLEFESSIDIFEQVRTELHALSKGDINTQAILTLVEADGILERSRGAFLGAEDVVKSYYNRIQQPIPQRFRDYRNSAISTYLHIREKIDKSDSIDWQLIKSFVSLALRSYISLQD